jgi:hypothetical protein
MNREISSINHKCLDTNIPFGVKKMDIAEISWIKDWPEFVDENNTLVDDIEFNIGKAFVSIDLLLQTSSYKYQFAKGLYTSNVDGLVKYTGASFKQNIDLVNRKEVIVQLTLENDDRIILGAPDNPVRLNIDTSVGKQVGDFIGHTLTLSWTSLHIPYYSSANVIQFATSLRIINAIFDAGNNQMLPLTINSLTEGDYDSFVSDPGSGAITFKIDTVVTPMPFTLAVGNVLVIERANAAAAGSVVMNGEYES